jgi:hypothetical protein
MQDTTEEGSSICISPSYWDEARLPEFVHDKFDLRDRVVPIISASISCDTFGGTLTLSRCAMAREQQLGAR